VLVPLIGEIAILSAFQFVIWALVRRQPWYTPPVMGAEDEDVNGSDNTVLFWFSCFQYIFVAAVLSVGPPFREPMYKNIPFILTMAGTVLLTLFLMTVNPDGAFAVFMNLTYASGSFKLLLVVLAMANFAICWVGYKTVLPSLSNVVLHIRRALGIKKIRKRYKDLKSELIAKTDV
jgi:cation-transporting ATPase 13A3/4/5